ncbi:MAG: hypothetical protein CVT59_01195 [Actinobacteria bacterium HGW-Actinobacteria-1]|nr:MAG: hypothetical protein CVT59_01195 [Actinobacteria bacterium HGW-Actinobacteria-1]
MGARIRGVVMVALLILVLVAAVALIRPVRTQLVTESQVVSIPFETQRVASAKLPIGSEATTQVGAEGRKVLYTYFEERSILGRVESRIEIAADGRPTERVELEPVDEIVEYGTAGNLTVDLTASAESGVDVGVIGSSGILLVKASGSIRYWKSGTCGPEGDPGHDYTFVPVRPTANVGALLFRVGDSSHYVAYSELEARDGMRVVVGTPGEHVIALINEAPGMYADNSGLFRIQVKVR